MATRRGFLGFLGIGAAAGPLAAKAAADAAIGEVAGLAKLGGLPTSATLGQGAAMLGDRCSPSVAKMDQYIPYEDRWRIVAGVLKTTGVPDFVDREWRDRARHVACLDPDIACKRSWSMAVKIQTQRERNYQRLREVAESMPFFIDKKSAFEKLFGFAWPW